MSPSVHVNRSPDLAVASRSDEVTATTEIAGFFGTRSARLFCSITSPQSPAACVLINSPLYAEHARNYRREVILARALAVRGIAAFRFHYRGTGHSEGSAEDLTFGSMCEDAFEAFDHLRARFPELPSGFVGTRLGGFVAASVAGSVPSAPLLLWDPVSSASRCVRDAMKAQQAGGMVTDRDLEASPEGEDGLWANGFVDVMGYRLPHTLIESFDGIGLSDRLGAEPRQVRMLSVLQRYESTAEMDALAGVLRARTGSQVDVRRVTGRLTWWISRDSWTPEEEHPVTREVVAESAEWLHRQLVKGRHRA